MPVGLAHPEWASVLMLVLAASALALVLAELRARQRWRRLLGLHGGGRRAGGHRDALLLGALLAIAVALVGPQIGTTTVRLPASGIDLVVLCDVSLSMDARDVPPSRLARARETAAAVLDALEPGDQVALAVFAGRGVLLTPLTPDHRALADMLPGLDSTLMLDQGSQLGSGVEAALAAFDSDSARPRVLLVLSDGEVSARDTETRLADLRRAGVRVIAAAFGRETGATVPVRGRPLRSSLGEIVISRRETPQLARLADASDGALVQADRWGVVETDALVETIRRDARATAEGWVERRVDVTRFAPFAALALLLLLVEAATPSLRRVPPAAAALAVLLGGLVVPATRAEAPQAFEAEVRARPEDPAALLRLGAARAEAGDPDEARRAFLAAVVHADDDATAALAYYDLGVVALQQGDLQGAREAFFDAIALAPGDKRAQFNLEWTLRALAATPPLPPLGPPEAAPPGAESQAEPRDRPQEGEGEPSGEGRREAERAVGGRGEEPPPTPPALDADRADHWLEAVRDDPSRALRHAVAAESQQTPRGPRW